MFLKNSALAALTLILCAVSAHAAENSPVNVATRITTELLAQGEPGNWLAHGFDYREQRFSPLEQINAQSIEQLGLAWAFDTDFNRGLQATPIVVDGVMFVSGNWNMVYALDARNGELLWKYDPQVPRAWAKMACCDVVNRGVAVYEGKVLIGTLDARLLALDAATGELLWEVQTADIEKYPYSITGAPKVARGKVFIGNGGAEYGVRGFVTAYDVNTGEQLWRFYTVPGNPADGFENDAMARAAETWTGEWWNFGGGGTVWDSIVYDAELNQLYLGVGNGSPWNHRIRSPEGGDNLYLSSIVALDPDTGDYLWHYQQTPGESWDFTATQHIMLADMEWQGESRKVIWQAPKNGFFFVIDRENGELLSAEPYARVNWATHYDMETGRPVETDIARYADGPQLIRPSSMGAHNWHPMAHHPDTGLVYIPAMDSMYEYKDVEEYLHSWGQWNVGVHLDQKTPPDPLLAQIIMRQVTGGSLLAWDPVRQQAAWSVSYPLPWNGGVLATAGNLVFQGTAEGEFIAYRADTGEKRWQFDARTGVMAGPVSYEVDGEQYISVLAGWGGAFGLIAGLERETAPPPSRVLTFKLGSNGQLPPNPEKVIYEPPARMEVDKAVMEKGRVLYHTYCHACHGQDAVSNGAVPDLRHMHPAAHESFNMIVLDGVMRNLGMVGFSDVLDEDDAYAIQAFIIDRAHANQKLRGQPGWWVSIKKAVYSVVARIISWLV